MTTPRSDHSGSCPEFRLSRRQLGAAALAGGGMAVFSDTFSDVFRQTAYAAGTDTNTVVVVSLRGGADSLSMLVPRLDAAYYRARPGIAVPADAVLATGDPAFGLHPSFGPVHDMWKQGRMAAVCAAGLQIPNRSHFDAIEQVEDADPGSAERIGWINRLIGLDQATSTLEAAQLGNPMLSASMSGPQPVLAAATASRIDLGGAPSLQRERRRALGQLYREEDGPLAVGLSSALQTTDVLGDMRAGYRPANGARYPAGSLGQSMADTARLIKKRAGLKLVALDHGSWDMHNNLGDIRAQAQGTMTFRVRELSESIRALFTDLGGLGDRVTLVTVTEFGRRLQQNGAGGLDHGWASAMFVFGAGVRGGRVVGTWPGLDAQDLTSGDLSMRTDYRTALSEVLANRFPSTFSKSKVFPGFVDGSRLELMKPV